MKRSSSPPAHLALYPSASSHLAQDNDDDELDLLTPIKRRRSLPSQPSKPESRPHPSSAQHIATPSESPKRGTPRHPVAQVLPPTRHEDEEEDEDDEEDQIVLVGSSPPKQQRGSSSSRQLGGRDLRDSTRRGGGASPRAEPAATTGRMTRSRVGQASGKGKGRQAGAGDGDGAAVATEEARPTRRRKSEPSSVQHEASAPRGVGPGAGGRQRRAQQGGSTEPGSSSPVATSQDVRKRHSPSTSRRPQPSPSSSSCNPPPLPSRPTASSPPSQIPTLSHFLTHLPLPLPHLTPIFHHLGISSPSSLLALSSPTEAGCRARGVLLDEVESLSRAEAEAEEMERSRGGQRGEQGGAEGARGMTRWERILVEEELKVGYWRWTGAAKEEEQSTRRA